MINLSKFGAYIKVEATGKKTQYTGRLPEIDEVEGGYRIVAGNVDVTVSTITAIQVAGVSVTDISDFETKIAEVFPDAGGAAITTLTKSELDTKVAAGTLGLGQYKLTGTTGQSGLYVDIYFTVVEPNIVPLECQGLFYNPDYQGVGDYSGVNAETGIGVYRGELIPNPDYSIANYNIGDIFLVDAGFDDVQGYKVVYLNEESVNSGKAVNQGIWSAAKEATLVNNQVVIWDGKHYIVIDSTIFDGLNPADNIDTGTGAYVEVDYTYAGLGGIPELDIIKYDYKNDWLAGREDKRGNKVSISYQYFGDVTSNSLANIQWGRNEFRGNVINDAIVESVINSTGHFRYNILNSGARFISFINENIIESCVFENNSTVDTTINAAIVNCRFSNGFFFDAAVSANLYDQIFDGITEVSSDTVADRESTIKAISVKHALDAVATEATARAAAVSSEASARAAADATKAPIVTQSAITYAATVTLDFNHADIVRTLALTGNVTFANASNKAATKEKVVIITADSSARTLSFPSWTFIGDAAPTSIAANKTAVLSLYCSGTTEASVIASYSVQS